MNVAFLVAAGLSAAAIIGVVVLNMGVMREAAESAPQSVESVSEAATTAEAVCPAPAPSSERVREVWEEWLAAYPQLAAQRHPVDVRPAAIAVTPIVRHHPPVHGSRHPHDDGAAIETRRLNSEQFR